jgi:hypothetical protein
MRTLALVCALGATACPPPVAELKPESPPLVLSGEAELECNIDSRSNGKQKLTLFKGGGLEFDAVVSPIVDGKISLLGPARGGSYQFTSHLAQPARGKLSGVGAVEIVELETRVSVEVTGYDQPQGPGTPFTFVAGQVKNGGAYIEFNGVARAVDGSGRWSFKLNLTEAREGQGRVEPANSNDNPPMVAKTVMVRGPTNLAVVETKAQVKRLP